MNDLKPKYRSLSGFEKAVFAHVGVFMIGATWALGGSPIHRRQRTCCPHSFEVAPPVATLRIAAAGDVRHDSMKRVAAAVGEGSSAVRSVHERLATQS